MLQSAEFLQVLEKKPTRLPAHNMKGYAALIEPSELDWSEAKLGCYGRDSCPGIDIVARYEYDLPLPFNGGIRSELSCWQMIEGFYEACSHKCLGHDFRREEPSQLLRSNIEISPVSERVLSIDKRSLLSEAYAAAHSVASSSA
jgi:hypothetical protein